MKYALLLFALHFSAAAQQELVQRFAPSFMVSEHDCAGLPAEFQAQASEPTVAAENGTIYAQIFPVQRPGKSSFFEIHYYHLWSRDCGRLGHPLDAEHVSALIGSEDNEHWHALYWYAAAHEDTICDSSHAASASALQATDHGPTVWISKDKHASFLDRQLCTGGCGRDQCDHMKPLATAKILLLEQNAAWVNAKQWPLAAKLPPDFNEPLIARLDSAQGAIPDNQARREVKAVVRVSDTTSSAILLGPQHASSALNTADEKTDKALRKSAHATIDWVKRHL